MVQVHGDLAGVVVDVPVCAPRADLPDPAAVIAHFGLDLVGHHDQLDQPFREVHVAQRHRPVFDHRSTLSDVSVGVELSTPSAARNSFTVIACCPVTGSTIPDRIWNVWARSSGPGCTSESRFSSTRVPRGKAQPDSADITIPAFGLS